MRDYVNEYMTEIAHDLVPDDKRGANPPSRSKPLGPKQLAWCRANLGNFAKYESQVLASKDERQAEWAEWAEKKERE